LLKRAKKPSSSVRFEKALLKLKPNIPTMADIQFTISEEKIRAMLFGDRGIEVLMEEVMNQLLQAEMTAHLRATPGEQTDRRRGYRNGSHERRLTTRVGTLCGRNSCDGSTL